MMARIRTIKPTHWADKELAKISLQAHLLWIALWNFSDDDGVFEGDPLLLKAQIFPRRTDVRVEQISSWLDQLVKARFLIPFQYKNEGYYVSRTFKTHQRIDKPQPGIIPLEVLENVFAEHSENVPRSFYPVEESKVEESNCKRKESAHAPSLFENPFSKNFLIDWELWKQFKKQQFKFSYKTVLSEQAAVNELVKISNGDEVAATKIIHQSIAQGWKGLFELKNDRNGSTKHHSRQGAGRHGESVHSAFSKIDRMPG